MTSDHTHSGIDRRTFLSMLAAGAGVAAAGPLLAACGGNEGAAGGGAGAVTSEAAAGRISQGDDLSQLIPTYREVNYVEPELPGANGVSPGYLSYPESPVRSVESPPGGGGRFTAMTPAFWPIPPGLGDNEYYQLVNDDLGATLEFTIVNGEDYGARLAANFAGGNVQDITCMPLWEGVKPQEFSAQVGQLFEDLTPYLAGDIADRWPNLANLPSRAWQYSVFNGKLYGMPFPQGLIDPVAFYRSDLFEELGVEPPTSAEEFLALAREINAPGEERWACGDMFVEARRMHNVPADWARRDGRLVFRYELDEYAAAVEFTRRLYEAECVHPDIVAFNTATSKELFEGGKMLMYVDGLGGAWHEALDRQRPSNPDFRMHPLPPYSATADTEPLYWAAVPAGIMGFVKRGTSGEKMEQILGMMNYIAAPYGTHEYEMVNYGARGTHHELDDNGVPALNEQGQREVTFTYGFLIGRPDIISKPMYPDYVEDNHAWQTEIARYADPGILDGLNVEEPPKFANLRQQFDDSLQDILRLRAPMSELQTAVDTWRSSGGDELREFYEEQLSAVGR